jgi:hypothetical protein
LANVFRGRSRADKRQVAAEELAVYGPDDPILLTDLTFGSDPEHFALLVPPLERHRPLTETRRKMARSQGTEHVRG